MRFDTLKATLLITSVILFGSCQKQFTIDDTPVINPPGGNSDSIRLVKYLEIDSIPGSGYDTSGVVTFEYDNQKRVISILSYNSTDPADNLANYEKYFYHYNGTDTLPDRLIYHLRNEQGTNLNIHTDTSYYTYTADGKLLSDSSNRNLNSSVNDVHYITKRFFNYQGSFFTNRMSDTDPSFAEESIDSVFLTFNGNNITGVKLARYTLPDYTNDYGHTSSYTYDTHPNPLYNIYGMRSTIQFFEFDNGPLALFQKNNVTAITQRSLADENVTENLTYSYNANGYPAVFYSTYSSDWSGTPEIRYYKGVFIYN